MSVLFKALAKAAKTRDASPLAPIGQALPLSRQHRCGVTRLPIILGLGLIALVLVAGLGAIFFLQDDQPKLTKLGSIKSAPTGVGAKIGVDTRLSPATPPLPMEPPATPALPPTTQPTAAPPAATESAPPPVATLVSAPTPTPAPASEPAKPASEAHAGQPPVETNAAEPHIETNAAEPHIEARTEKPPVEADLPAILEGIRRRKLSQSISPTITVERSSGKASTDDITVSVTAPMERDDAKTAYDLLIHGAYGEALQHYERALKAQPNNVALLLGKGTAEQKLQRNTEARETYRQVLALDGENREALTNMTAILALGAPEQALGDLRALEHNNPTFGPIPAQIALLESALGDNQAALTAITTAVRLAPDNALYRLNMAVLQDRAGMAAAAALSYQAVLDLIGPNESLPLPLAQIRRRLRFLQER